MKKEKRTCGIVWRAMCEWGSSVVVCVFDCCLVVVVGVRMDGMVSTRWNVWILGGPVFFGLFDRACWWIL